MEIDELLKVAIERDASDLHLKAGNHPIIRVHGTLIPLTGFPRLTSKDTQELGDDLMTDYQKVRLKEDFDIDLAYSLPGFGRFRGSIFQQRGSTAIALRIIPLEYPHKDKKSTICQREVGMDVSTFSRGLRATLREDPDVILVGEMRGLDTIETAILAAETGHLVFSTLHTLDAPESINRMIAVFAPHHQRKVRLQLGSILKAVIAQSLIPRMDGA